MRVIDVQQIVDLFIINGHRFRIALILDVRRADDRELIHPRNNKHYAFIFVLQNISLFLVCTRGTTMWLPLIRRMP